MVPDGFIIYNWPICGIISNVPDNCSYKHAIDGLWRVWREEGTRRLWGGASVATGRAVLMTVGQLAFYDQVKMYLLATPYFVDNVVTHFTASLTAVSQHLGIIFYIH